MRLKILRLYNMKSVKRIISRLRGNPRFCIKQMQINESEIYTPLFDSDIQELCYQFDNEGIPSYYTHITIIGKYQGKHVAIYIDLPSYVLSIEAEKKDDIDELKTYLVRKAKR